MMKRIRGTAGDKTASLRRVSANKNFGRYKEEKAAEVRVRRTREVRMVPLDQAVSWVKEWIADQKKK